MRATRSKTLPARELIGKKVKLYTKRLCMEYGNYENPDNCQYYELHRKGYSTGWKIVTAAIWQHDVQWYVDVEGTFNGQYYYIQVCERHIVDWLPQFSAGMIIDKNQFEYGYNHLFNCDIVTLEELDNHIEELHHEAAQAEEDYYNAMYGDDDDWDQEKLEKQRQKDQVEIQEKAVQAADVSWSDWWYGISKGVGGGSGAGTFQKAHLN
jgi:hypothetical protein